MPIAEKCTKTSSPPSRSMKPKPFSFENHLTVPSAKTLPPCRQTNDPNTESPSVNESARFYSVSGRDDSVGPLQPRGGDRVLENHCDRHRPDSARHRRNVR